jgi:ankyrin repeat protein
MLKLDNIDVTEALHKSVSYRFTTITDYLLKYPIIIENIDSLDKDNNTALIQSLRAENYEHTKLLLEARANTEIKNKQGKTALDIAINKKNKEIITKIILNSNNCRITKAAVKN